MEDNYGNELNIFTGNNGGYSWVIMEYIYSKELFISTGDRRSYSPEIMDGIYGNELKTVMRNNGERTMVEDTAIAWSDV